jgi:hypothetical protein
LLGFGCLNHFISVIFDKTGVVGMRLNTYPLLATDRAK